MAMKINKMVRVMQTNITMTKMVVKDGRIKMMVTVSINNKMIKMTHYHNSHHTRTTTHNSINKPNPQLWLSRNHSQIKNQKNNHKNSNKTTYNYHNYQHNSVKYSRKLKDRNFKENNL